MAALQQTLFVHIQLMSMLFVACCMLSMFQHLTWFAWMQNRPASKDNKYVQYMKTITKRTDVAHVSHGWGTLNYPIRNSAKSGHAYAGAGGDSGSWREGDSISFLGSDVQSHLSASGLQPGQTHTPARIGRDQHPLMADTNTAGLFHAARSDNLHATVSSSPAAGGSHAGHSMDLPSLERERVVCVAASKYFSVAVTDKGEVWTFGADYNGSLGSDISWSTSAQLVTGVLAKAIQAAGGAVTVAAGKTFCVCKTASGRVLVWGKLGGGFPMVRNLSWACKDMVAEVAGLPPIKSIAAGQHHALLTDGERVWCIGSWLTAAGGEAGCASWEQPAEVLHVPDEGVVKVVAGYHASAAITGDGRVYMWGRLVDDNSADAGMGKVEQGSVLNPVDWGWAGFGADKPKLVDALTGVKDLALGGYHALALVG